MTISSYLREDALRRLRGRLFRDGPRVRSSTSAGLRPVVSASRRTEEDEAILAAARRDIADGRFAHFDPDTLPLTWHDYRPVADEDAAGEGDEDFLDLMSAARDEVDEALVVLIRLPDRDATGSLAADEVEKLRAVTAERVAVTLGVASQVKSSGHDVLVLVRRRRLGQELRRRLAELTDVLATPIPLDRGHALVRPQLALVPLGPTADVPPAAALRAVRASLPMPGVLSWATQPEPGDSSGDIAEVAGRLLRARTSTAADRFVLLYREIQSLGEPGVVGGLAVPAWVDTDGVEHTFAELDDVAESTGLSREIFDRTLPAICRDLMLWRATRRMHTPHVLLKVPEQLLRERYLEGRLAEVLRSACVPPSLLILGIPAAALAAVEGIDEHLYRLGGLGVQLAVTGYGDADTPLGVLTRRRWNLAVVSNAVLAKLEDHHPDGVDAERVVVQTLVRTAQQLRVLLLAEDTHLTVARRVSLDDLIVPPRHLITAAELAEHRWIALPEFPPERPEPRNLSMPRAYSVPVQRRDR